MDSEKLARIFHDAYEGSFNTNYKNVQKTKLEWDDMPSSYQKHMIETSGIVLEELYDSHWRLVRLREWLGAYLVTDEVRRSVKE